MLAVEDKLKSVAMEKPFRDEKPEAISKREVLGASCTKEAGKQGWGAKFQASTFCSFATP